MWWQHGSATSWKGACLSQLGLGTGCQHHTYMVWEAEMAILRTWNPHVESCSNASGVVSNFTLYFKVSMHVPMKSSSNYIYFHAFLQTSISGVQHENVQLPRAMQVAQDAPKLLPNVLALCAEDMMNMRKVWERVKTLSTRKQIQYIKCSFPTEIPFLRLY